MSNFLKVNIDIRPPNVEHL
ncbi:hypothetical protein [Terrihalobacillus insolitus]